MLITRTVRSATRGAVAALARGLAALRPTVVEAHCDTADGPAVTDGRRALETGNVVPALAWIPADGEAELREVFAKVLAVRTLSPDAAEVADRLFLETLVRLHRAGEGVGFTGIKPAGTPVDPMVATADAALESGSDAGLLGQVPEDRRAELHRRFAEALAARDAATDPFDLAAARRRVGAYVAYVLFAEGHDHGHESGHDHGHDHQAHGDDHDHHTHDHHEHHSLTGAR